MSKRASPVLPAVKNRVAFGRNRNVTQTMYTKMPGIIISFMGDVARPTAEPIAFQIVYSQRAQFRPDSIPTALPIMAARPRPVIVSWIGMGIGLAARTCLACGAPRLIGIETSAMHEVTIRNQAMIVTECGGVLSGDRRRSPGIVAMVTGSFRFRWQLGQIPLAGKATSYRQWGQGAISNGWLDESQTGWGTLYERITESNSGDNEIDCQFSNV